MMTENLEFNYEKFTYTEGSTDEGEVFIISFDDDSPLYKIKGAVGFLFLDWVNEVNRADDLIRSILDEYDVSESTLRKDLDTLIEEMTKVGILVSTR